MKKILITSLLLFITSLSYSFNIRVAPTGFIEDISKTVAREVYVMNETTEPMRVMVDIEEDPLYEKYSLIDNIKVFPKVLSIPPKGKRLVRFRLVPDEDMTDGEYKAYLIFKELANERSKEDMVSDIKDDSKGVKLDIKMLTEMGISIYGIRGERTSEITILEDKLSKIGDQWQVDITGDVAGNYSVLIIGEFIYYDDKNNKLGTHTISDDIMRNSREKIQLSLENIPQNTKRIEATYKSNENKILKNNKYIL